MSFNWNNLASIIGSVANLGGSLTSGWSSSASQIDGLINEINVAAAEGNWDQVVAFGNDIIAMQNVSVATRDIAQQIISAAQKGKLMASPGMAPATAAIVAASSQQLVLSLTASLHTQVSGEGSGMFRSLAHMQWLQAHGRLPGA